MALAELPLATAEFLAVDVETNDDDRWVETTLIGPGFGAVRTALAAGPAPLPIVPSHTTDPEERPDA